MLDFSYFECVCKYVNKYLNNLFYNIQIKDTEKK